MPEFRGKCGCVYILDFTIGCTHMCDMHLAVIFPKTRSFAFRNHAVHYIEKGLEPYHMFEGWEHESKSRDYCLRDNDIVVDVGACIGGWAIPAAVIGKYVYAFEPNREYADILRLNIHANGLNNIEVIDKAVSDIDGLVPFDGWTIESETPTEAQVTQYANIARLAERDYEPAESTTPGIKLDTFCVNIKPDFIKIDVEGQELRVIAGAAQTLASKPRLMIEAHKEYDKDVVGKIERAIFDINPNYTMEIIYDNEWQVADLYFL